MLRVTRNNPRIQTIVSLLTMNSGPPYNFMPWPWNAPRFASMWNECSTGNATTTFGSSSGYNQQSRIMNTRYPLAPGMPVYRRSPPMSATTSALNFTPRQLMMTSQARASSSSSHTFTHSMNQNPHIVNQSSQNRKRERLCSESDDGSKPVLSKPRIDQPSNTFSGSPQCSSNTSQVHTETHPQSKPYTHDSKPYTHDDTHSNAFQSNMSTSTWTPMDTSQRGTETQNMSVSHTSNYAVTGSTTHQWGQDMDHRKSEKQDLHESSNKESSHHSRDGESSEKNSNLYKRQFVYTHFGKKHMRSKRGGVEFSVLSYNVLAQGLIEVNDYLYTQCAPNFLQWDYRKNNLLREIKELNPDVLCLQEVQENHFNNFYQPQLALLGYDGVYKCRTGDKHDGCATFHRKSKFTSVKHELVEYHRQGTQPLDRDNVGIIMLLKPVKSKYSHQRVCVANTHLLFNPKRGDVKLAQLGILFSEIDKIATKSVRKNTHEYYPIILCGDMNSEPYSPLYKFISKGYLMYHGMDMTSISGQHRGFGGRTLPYPLWSRRMGVTDKCQYASEVEDRKEKATSKGDDGKSTNERVKDNEEDYDGNWEMVLPKGVKHQFSDTIRHNFLFKSAYSHNAIDNSREVTTNHDRTNCTVDYIFYSTSSEQRPVKTRRGSVYYERCEGRLKLINKLSLYSDKQASKMGGLPNHRISSDHFSLLATFLLEK